MQSTDAGRRQRKRVLVVDDEPMVTDWLKMVIEQGGGAPGYEVRAPPSVARAEDLPHVAAGRGAARSGAARHRRHRAAAADEGHRRLARDDRDQRRRARSPARSKPGRPARSTSSRNRISIPPASSRSSIAPPTCRSSAPQHERLKEQVRDQYAFSNIIGKSKKMRELFELIEAVAESDANILIQGENGVGKELIANAIHVRSGRAQGPVHQDQLRGAPEGADRVGAVRLQEGRVHRRDQRQGRPARARQPAAR